MNFKDKRTGHFFLNVVYLLSVFFIQGLNRKGGFMKIKGLLLLFIFTILFLSNCTSESEKGLAEGVSFSVERVRTWGVFKSDLPENKENISYNHWFSNSIHITNIYNMGSKLLSGSRSVKEGEKGYTVTIKTFAPYQDLETPKPSGRFCELLVFISNIGKKEQEIGFLGNGQYKFNARLITTDKKTIEVHAFLIPGLDVAPISLIAAWEGSLNTRLKPGEKTWIILVFDIPLEITLAELQIKDASPVHVTLPRMK
jgi:hypothetical protein